MFVKKHTPWLLKESAVTDETIYLNRRRFNRNLVALASSLTLLSPKISFAEELLFDPKGTHKASPLNEMGALQNTLFQSEDRDITEEKYATTYNNFYEFGSSKRIWQKTQKLPLEGWRLKIEGLVEKPKVFSIDDLIKKMPLEERIYRHRCVEAWAMVVPWTGFPLKDLLKHVNPLSKAKYVVFESFYLPDIADTQKRFWLPWPYVEALSIEEAKNSLAFLSVGAYGKKLLPQNGAPIRLTLPWKYGFKSIKSIVKISFVEQKPKTFWSTLQSSEYGFWANVNPNVPHKRWSQETERLLGTNKRYPTKIYNGYEEWVAELYKNLKDEQNIFY